MSRDHSVIIEIASKYCISDSFVDHEGYSISSKGFLPTVVDKMVIWVKFTHSSPFQFADSLNVDVHSCHLLFDHLQFALIHGPDIPGSYAIEGINSKLVRCKIFPRHLPPHKISATQCQIGWQKCAPISFSPESAHVDRLRKFSRKYFLPKENTTKLKQIKCLNKCLHIERPCQRQWDLYV